MSLFLPIKKGGCVAVAICQRCNRKFPYDELQKDPNNGLMVCKDDLDLFDPYRKPPRQTEDVSLQRPRPDVGVNDA